MKRNEQGGYVIPEPGGYQRGNPVMGSGIESMVAGERSWPECEHDFKRPLGWPRPRDERGQFTVRCRHCGQSKAEVKRASMKLARER